MALSTLQSSYISNSNGKAKVYFGIQQTKQIIDCKTSFYLSSCQTQEKITSNLTMWGIGVHKDSSHEGIEQGVWALAITIYEGI